jgi:glycosyltransferase involved in cell wall biosynthesis
MIEMMVQLKQNEVDARLHLVGWEEDTNKPVEIQCIKLAEEKGVDEIVLFHGKKKIGPELDAMYRMADIFLIPSYHEGFPRVIWEAMANSLPVIATKVGAIPFTLKDQEDALLIAPQDSDQLTAAVLQLISSASLRKQLIKSGYQLASQNTLENQTATMLNIISTYLNNFPQTEN